MITEYENLISKRDLILRLNESGFTMEQAIKELIDFLNKAEPFTEYDDSVFERFIEKITVVSREEVEFELKFGLKLRERLI